MTSGTIAPSSASASFKAIASTWCWFPRTATLTTAPTYHWSSHLPSPASACSSSLTRTETRAASPAPSASADNRDECLAALLQRLDLGQAAHVPLLVREGGAQERPDQILRQRGADDARADDQHVHVVVFDALVGRVAVVADGGADAGDLVGRHRRPHAAAADQDAALRAPVKDGAADRLGGIRIIDRRRRRRAHVHQLVPRGGDGLAQPFFQLAT